VPQKGQGSFVQKNNKGQIKNVGLLAGQFFDAVGWKQGGVETPFQRPGKRAPSLKTLVLRGVERSDDVRRASESRVFYD